MKYINVVLFSVLFFLSSCATNRPLGHDPNAKEFIGRITYKEMVTLDQVREKYEEELLKRQTEDFMRFLFTGYSSLNTNSVSGKALEYRVLTNDGYTFTIFSEHIGFDVGNCVVVFVSKDTEKYPPSMAYSSKKCVN